MPCNPIFQGIHLGCMSGLQATTQPRWQENVCPGRGKCELELGITVLLHYAFCIMNYPGCSLMSHCCQRSSHVCHVTKLHLHIFMLAVQCLCQRSCFSPSVLQPSKCLQFFMFALLFCLMRHQLINTTSGFYINSWQACWPIIPLMNANGPSHSESYSDMDAHAPLNMHTHIWIRLSTSPLYYFVALMKCRGWRPLARAAPEFGLTPAASHRRSEGPIKMVHMEEHRGGPTHHKRKEFRDLCVRFSIFSIRLTRP